MRRFIRGVTLFILPIVILAIPPFVLLKGTKESYVDVVPYLKSEQEFLMGYAYNENNIGYTKWKTLEMKKFPLVILGSSRVLQFRAKMFDIPTYNAGYTIKQMSDFKVFLNSLPKENYPETLVIGIDQWLFSENWQNEVHNDRYWSNSFVSTPKISNLIKVYKDWLRGKYGLGVIFDKSPVQKIGLNAIVNSKGFRKDGSIYYGNQIKKLILNDSTRNDYLFQETLKSVISGKKKRFNHGQNINAETIEHLEDLINFCKINRIKLIAFCPPYSNLVFEKIQSTGSHTYINKVEGKLDSIFSKSNIEFYYYPNAVSCNSKDEEFIDGFHGGEVTYLKLLCSMLDNGSTLNEVTNRSRLNNDLDKRKNDYIVYD
jgi:hypothetical protein